MTFYEVIIKIHENNSLTFVRNFDTSYQNFNRNGVYTVKLESFPSRELTTEDIYATDWEIYNEETMEYIEDI